MGAIGVFQPFTYYTYADAEAARRANDISVLRVITCSMAVLHHDWKYVQQLGIRLAKHPDERVRANALYGLGYVAQCHHKLDKAFVKPVLLRGVHDPSPVVQESAGEAIAMVNFAMRWRIGRRPVEGTYVR